MEAGVVIDFENIKACYQLLAASTDNVVVEGVGGWKVPLGQNQAVPDLALALQLPVIMVVGLRIGCINHAVLTAEAIKRDGLQLKAWVASQLEPVYPTLDPSLEYLKAKIGAPMLGYIPFSETLNFADMGAKLDLGLL
jgi:dethiobiotin synthetase